MSIFFALAASASAEPLSTPSLAHALLGAALFPANATILANHRQLKGKAKTVPLPKRLQKTYPACSGHADEVAGKRAAAEWDKCKNKQVFYFNLGKALELGKKAYPDEFGLKERTDGLEQHPAQREQQKEAADDAAKRHAALRRRRR